jgi:hypothetical protein
MFNKMTHTYLSNADLGAGLAHIQQSVLHGKKIDILAFDTCMGCMMEIATCVAPYAEYLLGVQSCALVDGFNYQEFVAALNNGTSARQTAIDCIRAFDLYYAEHDHTGIYTCTALDLSCIDALNGALNLAVEKLCAHPDYLPHLQEAHAQTPRFCLWPIYTDVVAFLKLVEQELIDAYAIQDGDGLLKTLHDVYHAVQKAVVARCGGYTTEGKAYGIAIYLPHATIEDSYRTSQFAHLSQWINLLETVCG